MRVTCWSFNLLPVRPTNLAALKSPGAKAMVYHGVSDAIFSVDDTTSWYEGLRAANAGDASDFARFFRVLEVGGARVQTRHLGIGAMGTAALG